MVYWDNPHWESWRGRLREATEKKPGYQSQLEFAAAILEAQGRAWEGLPAPQISISEAESRTRLEGGFLLVDRDRVQQVPPDIEKLPLQLARIVSARKQKMQEEAADFLAAADLGKVKAGKWLAGEFRETPGEREVMKSILGVSDHLLDFLSFNSLRPFWLRLASLCSVHLKPELWEKGSCPVCGQAAAVGELRGEEGTRFLVCTRCGTEWPFPRIRCASCDNTEMSTLKYLFFDEEPGYRIHVCQKCRAMCKIMDSRKLPPPLVPEVEDLLTPHLTYLAASEGYHRTAPNILGLS